MVFVNEVDLWASGAELAEQREGVRSVRRSLLAFYFVGVRRAASNPAVRATFSNKEKEQHRTSLTCRE